MKGKISPLKKLNWESPPYLYLPAPTEVKSDFPLSNRYSIIVRKNFIGWDVTWKGKKLCNQVLSRSRENLHYWKKNEILFKNKRNEKMDEVIKTIDKNIKKWQNIIDNFEKQMITDATIYEELDR